MSQSNDPPGGAPAPGSAPPTSAPAPDVAKQIADLTDAVNRLVQAQQRPAPTAPAPTSAPDASLDVGGEIPGGTPLTPAVDYAKLAPVQQIALGLREARPVGPAHRAMLNRDTRPSAPTDASDDNAHHNGAD